MSDKTVNLVITSPHSMMAPLARQYWELAADGQWAHGVLPLSKRARVTQAKFLSMIQEICYVTLPNLVCKDCQKPHRVHSRSEWQQLRRIRRPDWQCWTCRQARQHGKGKSIDQREGIIRSLCESGQVTIATADSMPFLDAIAILALVSREQSTPTLIRPIMPTDRPSLAPGDTASISIAKQLFLKGLVVPVGACPPVALSVDGQGRTTLDMRVAIMKIGVRDPAQYSEFISRLEARLRTARQRREDLAQLQDAAWFVARLECEAYLYGQLLVRKLEWRPQTNALQPIWTAILERYSVSQACYFIWRVLADQAKDPAKSSPAAFKTRLERLVAHAIDDSWNIDGFERPGGQLQSLMSNLIFNTSLGASGVDVGFHTRIHDILSIFSQVAPASLGDSH